MCDIIIMLLLFVCLICVIFMILMLKMTHWDVQCVFLLPAIILKLYSYGIKYNTVDMVILSHTYF